MARFIKVENKMVNLDAIAYADFLESGRAMLIMSGLTPEKQNVSLGPADAKRLMAALETEAISEPNRLPSDSRLPALLRG
jgi:hypothetical protein